MKDIKNLIKVIRLASVKLLSGPDSTPSRVEATVKLRRTVATFLSLVHTDATVPDQSDRARIEWAVWGNVVRGADSPTQFIIDLKPSLEYVIGSIFLSLYSSCSRDVGSPQNVKSTQDAILHDLQESEPRGDLQCMYFTHLTYLSGCADHSWSIGLEDLIAATIGLVSPALWSLPQHPTPFLAHLQDIISLQNLQPDIEILYLTGYMLLSWVYPNDVICGQIGRAKLEGAIWDSTMQRINFFTNIPKIIQSDLEYVTESILLELYSDLARGTRRLVDILSLSPEKLGRWDSSKCTLSGRSSKRNY